MDITRVQHFSRSEIQSQLFQDWENFLNKFAEPIASENGYVRARSGMRRDKFYALQTNPYRSMPGIENRLPVFQMTKYAADVVWDDPDRDCQGHRLLSARLEKLHGKLHLSVRVTAGHSDTNEYSGHVPYESRNRVDWMMERSLMEDAVSKMEKMGIPRYV